MVLNIESQIEILLFDQNKIVSYKELGNKFNLTPFEARKEINKYITKKSNDEKSKIHFTYLIIGEDKTTKIKRIFLKNETDLDKVNDNFKILSKQIYSIQANEINDFDLIYASDLDASHNVNRKSNLKVTSKLGEIAGKLVKMDIESTQSDDDLMMAVDIPKETKKATSKTDNQENKPVVKKLEVKKELETKSSDKKDAVLKDMDQILPKKEEPKESKSIFKNDAKKQKVEINAPGTAPAAKPTAAKGKKTTEPSKKQPTMMSFFKKV